MPSRKTVSFIIGILTALGAAIAGAAGVDVDFKAIGAVALTLITYLQFQAKLDIKKIAQMAKWKDPKWYVALVAIILAQLGAFLNIEIPTTEIVAVLNLLLMVLFGKSFKDNPTY